MPVEHVRRAQSGRLGRPGGGRPDQLAAARRAGCAPAAPCPRRRAIRPGPPSYAASCRAGRGCAFEPLRAGGRNDCPLARRAIGAVRVLETGARRNPRPPEQDPLESGGPRAQARRQARGELAEEAGQ